MAHAEQLFFVSLLVKHINLLPDSQVKILEVGSYDVNGSVRTLLPQSHYLGLDLLQGPGVDLVSSDGSIPSDIGSFDIAISCECFEHNPYWPDTLKAMLDRVVDNGLLIISCATRGRLEHGTIRTSPESSPGTQSRGWDYYKNLVPKDFFSVIDIDSEFDDYIFLTNRYSKDLYFVGSKGKGKCRFAFESARFKLEYYKEVSKFNKVRSAKRDTHPVFGVLAQYSIGLPLILLSFLPDNIFQQFALPYTRFELTIKNFVKKYICK
jgi:SAM-dependent methyltransferase